MWLSVHGSGSVRVCSCHRSSSRRGRRDHHSVGRMHGSMSMSRRCVRMSMAGRVVYVTCLSVSWWLVDRGWNPHTVAMVPTIMVPLVVLRRVLTGSDSLLGWGEAAFEVRLVVRLLVLVRRVSCFLLKMTLMLTLLGR